MLSDILRLGFGTICLDYSGDVCTGSRWLYFYKGWVAHYDCPQLILNYNIFGIHLGCRRVIYKLYTATVGLSPLDQSTPQEAEKIYKMSEPQKLEYLPAPLIHIGLVILTILPLFVQIPPNINVILTAVATVFAGSWRSVKPEPPTEAMTKMVGVLLVNHITKNIKSH